MALVVADRVKETTTTSGTGAITLAGAAYGFRSFSAAIGDGNTTYYCISDQAGANWEVGIGTFTASSNTLARTTVLSSSNAGSLVNFDSATKDVFVTLPASKAPFPPGTAMLFIQSTAPTGWTKSTTHNDKALRIVSGTAGSGGSVAFSTAFASKTPSGSVSVSGSVGSTTLDVSQIPSHNNNRIYSINRNVNGTYDTSLSNTAENYSDTTHITYTGGSGSHNHSFSGSGSFSGSAIDLTVQYVDAIIATKD